MTRIYILKSYYVIIKYDYTDDDQIYIYITLLYRSVKCTFEYETTVK